VGTRGLLVLLFLLLLLLLSLPALTTFWKKAFPLVLIAHIYMHHSSKCSNITTH
jgi:hypothetical protein